MAMDNNSSLGNSMRKTSTLNMSSNKAGKMMTAEEKARNKEAIGNMASALNSIKNNRGANNEEINSARKMSTLNMESIGSSASLGGRGGSKSPRGPNSAAATPNSGAKSGSSKIGGISRRSTVFYPGAKK